MLHFHGNPSPTKSFPGLISATAEGLTVHAQSVIHDGARYDVPETPIPIAHPGEPVTYRVLLTPSGIVLDERIESTQWADVAGIVLAHFRLVAEGDTPATVDVHVMRREFVPGPKNPLPERVAVTIPPVLITPAATPERAAQRARGARIRAIDALLAGKKAATLTAADRNLVIERLALLSGMEP